MTPKEAPNATFRESILMGNYSGTYREIEDVVSSMRSEFRGESYNLLTKNCNCFAQALVKRLVNRDIPGCMFHYQFLVYFLNCNLDVNRMAEIGSLFSCLLPASMTGEAPVGATDQQRLIQPATVPFSGAGFKVGGSSTEVATSVTSSGLNDRRERMRQAALSRMTAQSSS